MLCALWIFLRTAGPLNETLPTNLQHPPQALVHLLLLPCALLAASLSPPAIQHPLALRQDARKGWDERHGEGEVFVCLHACVCFGWVGGESLEKENDSVAPIVNAEGQRAVKEGLQAESVK